MKVSFSLSKPLFASMKSKFKPVQNKNLYIWLYWLGDFKSKAIKNWPYLIETFKTKARGSVGNQVRVSSDPSMPFPTTDQQFHACIETAKRLDHKRRSLISDQDQLMTGDKVVALCEDVNKRSIIFLWFLEKPTITPETDDISKISNCHHQNKYRTKCCCFWPALTNSGFTANGHWPRWLGTASEKLDFTKECSINMSKISAWICLLKLKLTWQYLNWPPINQTKRAQWQCSLFPGLPKKKRICRTSLYYMK